MIDTTTTTTTTAPAAATHGEPPGGWGYQSLLIRQIRRDGGTQARIGLNEETVQEYAELMREHRWDFRTMQRPIALYDGSDFWLADGFHRIEAAQRAQLSDYPIEVLRGTKRDAILRAAGANSQHGLRRTNADKRRAVELLLRDQEWGQWSDRKIADVCAVDHKTVADVRKALSGEIPQIETRTVERAGTTYQMTPATPKPATCVRCGKGRDLHRQLTSYDVDLVPEYPGRAVTLCSTCIPELLRARVTPAPLPSEDEQHRITIEAILKEAADKGERTGTRLYQQAYDHAREIRDVGLYNKMIALIDRVTDTPIAPAPELDATSDRQAHLAKEAQDRSLLSTARANIDVGNIGDARRLLDQVQTMTWERDQLLRVIARDAALAFHNDQRARLKNFSAAAMISQTTYTQALDHIEALLNVVVTE